MYLVFIAQHGLLRCMLAAVQLLLGSQGRPGFCHVKDVVTRLPAQSWHNMLVHLHAALFQGTSWPALVFV
jgi:hypothetical protein